MIHQELDGVEIVEHTSPRAGVEVTHLEFRARRDLVGIATGRFSRPAVGVRWRRDAIDPSAHLLGFAFTQFALPVTADRSLRFDFRPAPGLRSPSAVTPLLVRDGDGRVVLLAPLTGAHEQVAAIDDDGITWGWHGDLDVVPADWSTTMAIYRAESVTAALDAWGVDLSPTRSRHAEDPLLTHLSYWSDNGAAYWYRTEPGRTITTAISDKIAELDELGVPVRTVELDSWFYDHEHPRAIAEIGYPDLVPPTGAMSWTPRADAFDDRPAGDDPIATFRRGIGDRPLALHARHISPRSPYVTDGRRAGDVWWVDEFAAHPADPGFFARWFADARRWGATCVEQDWMQVIWFAVRELRSHPGRARDWLTALDRHAGDTDLGLLFCMSTPADMIEASSLDRVVAVRTCDDYRFADDPAFLWTWFLTVNRLANTLGIPAFKDCFFSNPHPGDDRDSIDGDAHAELEALLAALSGGPVGIGDRRGRTDVDIVRRTCDADGRLRPVDRAIALVDDCLFGEPERGERLAWATTTATQHDGAVVTYVVAINTSSDRIEVTDSFVVDGARSVYDWRRRRMHPSDDIEVTLRPRDWAFFVCRDRDGMDDAGWIGDPDRYVTNPTRAAPVASTG